MKRVIAISICATVLAGSSFADERITNGGFESNGGVGTTTFTGWTTSAASGNVKVSSTAHTGVASALFDIDPTDGAVGDLSQTITLTQLSDVSSFGAWVRASGQTLLLDIQDGKGGLFEYSKYFKGNPDRNRGWIYWDILGQIKGGSLTQISAIDFEIKGENSVTRPLNIDDVSLQAVPEPSSFCAIAAGAGLVLLRRRRRN